MSRLPLDEFRDQVAAEQNDSPGRRRRILLLLIAVVSGVILGFFIAQTWLVPAPPQTLQLSRADQDDYILMVAEAYAIDRDPTIAQQRLARLNDPRTTERIIALAREYASQQDYVAGRLALLAVAAGSKDAALVQLAATVTAPTHTPTPTVIRRATEPLAADAPPPTATPEPRFVVVTGVPTATPTIYYIVVTGEPPTPGPPTWTPTPSLTTFEQRPDVVVPMPAGLVAQRIPLYVPGYANFASAEIRLAARPRACTPADRMPPVVTQSTLLCAGQTYVPFTLRGDNLTLYGDAEKTALVRGYPRQFAITVQGSNISIVGVHVEGATHENDLNRWLCLYPNCFHTPEIGGALGYGGGILLENTSNAAVLNSQFNSGTTGVFVDRGFSNKVTNNSFSDHNGWGLMLMQTKSDYVVGNQFVNINRACDGLDNVYHANGCESSALVMTDVLNTLVLNNQCRGASNCYYANGDGGYGSANIRFYNNQCAGAKNNCFEVTFGSGHEFDYNTAVFDDAAGAACDYPFWIGGSTAYFGPNNRWECLHDYDTALNDARAKSDQPTEAFSIAEKPPAPPPVPARAIQPAAQPAIPRAPEAQ